MFGANLLKLKQQLTPEDPVANLQSKKLKILFFFKLLQTYERILCRQNSHVTKAFVIPFKLQGSFPLPAKQTALHFRKGKLILKFLMNLNLNFFHFSRDLIYLVELVLNIV